MNIPVKMPCHVCSKPGFYTGETILCPTCRGHVERKIYACEQHWPADKPKPAEMTQATQTSS